MPRWTLDPVPGVARAELPLGADLVAAVDRLAAEFSLPGRTVALAAHAKVLAALSGDKDVIAGYAAAGGKVLPLPLSTEFGSWSALLADVEGAEARLSEHAGFDVDALRAELDLPGPSFETVFDADFDRKTFSLVPGLVLRVGLAGDALVVDYRTDVIDAACAARIAGYHRTALERIVEDPDAPHDTRTLVGPEELEFQIDGLKGKYLDLGDKRFHELFEDRVRRHPDAVAGVHGDTTWTYAELNSRANQLGRALLARGLRREGVVAVVTERNLDWMASVIAIFKAGGAYLPIEPHFPADRIATTLGRAETQLVLTEQGSTETLDVALESLNGLEKTYIDVAYGEGHDDSDLGIEVTPDQLAYMYFTSGSTGTPKGAMCEQLGMLNHLWAKINDLGLGEGEVMTEIAPQCFDISLWQLVSALLQGGRTVIIEQDVILDVARFVEKIVEQRVNVMQVVPSYLEVVCSYLEQFPTELPDLHCVSTTGEALKYELVQRWFALQPNVKVANAYGLTETSDDTNHEVMDRVPDGGRVPLGPPVNNVWIYVMDDHLQPVPLGAPGEIVFSGICVGRGYINDPERTAAAFQSDPLRPGERIYRSGDHGRWAPDGKLDFMGRKDTQIKLRGFRIEIGEIDNKLLKVPGVGDGAVVVGERSGDGSKHLVAFYSGPKPLDTDMLREQLGASLPEYMVPSAFHHRERLPLTGNGKVDTKTLTKLASELLDSAGSGEYEAPATPTEVRVAEAFAAVLEVPYDQVSRTDDFFDRGSSLSAVKLAVALDRKVSLKEITRTPVLADLAQLLDAKSGGVPVPAARHGLLQPLSTPAGTPVATLVCFPYAGGNAINFQPMARALKDAGVAVHAVELPGHDLASEREPFMPAEKVVEQVVAEIADGLVPDGTKLLLWGHSAGTALAIEAARQLDARGVFVERVFLGAQLLGTAELRRNRIAEIGTRSDTDIAAWLSTDSGYTELGQLDAQRAGLVGAAYRHDYLGANGYFADVIENPPAVRLAAPITAVLAADDPSIEGFEVAYRHWQLLAERVDLHQVAGGGHYFLRTNPAEAAAAVLAALPSA
jgi:amino acid adenylation domain-containing protein